MTRKPPPLRPLTYGTILRWLRAVAEGDRKRRDAARERKHMVYVRAHVRRWPMD